MKFRSLLPLLALALFVSPLSAQQSYQADRHDSWVIKRGNAGYKTDKTPAQDIYKEGMNHYLGTKGYKRDCKKAIALFEEAAQAGNQLAQYQLGNCYRYGNGVGIDKKKAAEYWHKSAEAGCIEAKYELGCLYYNGDGVKRNHDKAFTLFMEGAEAGHHASLYMAGECYSKGKGVKKDKKKAVEYWEKAAAKGNHKAKDRIKE